MEEVTPTPIGEPVYEGQPPTLTGKEITEEMGIHNEWYEKLDDITMDNLQEFINHLVNDYTHDYGTICHAITAAGMAAMKAVNRSPEGGITGFQAGAIMWEFISRWMHIKGPAKLVEYEQMLFPQYKEKFQKVISKDTWQWLQEKARSLLEENDASADNVRNH